MAHVPFDPENPPEQPPEGCSDPLLWRVARALHLAHQPEPDNRCTCGEVFPCGRAALAVRGLLAACTCRPPQPAGSGAGQPRRWPGRAI
jgi:hypothetical protein